MKYAFQLMIILGFCLAGELLNALIPLSIPASVYGLLLLFLLLLTGIIRLEQVEGVANFLMTLMPLFFLEPSVRLMESFGLIRNSLPALAAAIFLSFAAVVAVTGMTAQWIVRHKNASKEGKEEDNGNK